MFVPILSGPPPLSCVPASSFLLCIFPIVSSSRDIFRLLLLGVFSSLSSSCDTLSCSKLRLWNGDIAGTKKAVIDILQLCFEARAWKTLNDQIAVLSKRRGQSKQVRAMVKDAKKTI
ncbi:hypothetical protein L1887_03423 [Cichorium endivia]|nr:hypothetical protein L1887_03423 [Cichorium endivia]